MVETLWAVGLTAIGGILVALGLVLMKLAHVRREKHGGKLPLICTPIWIYGFINLFIGTVLHIIALGFGNQLLLSATGALAIIANTVLSVVILNETCHRSDPLAIFLMCLGSGGFLFCAKNDPE